MDKIEQDMITKSINEVILKQKERGFSTKDISDKWHTFEELYYHRMILFLTIQKSHLDKSWKSKQHHDGTMFDDSFIVGIETPEGQYSYHYDLKYWDLFKDIKELEKAPEYDGHKPEDIDRLLSLFKKECCNIKTKSNTIAKEKCSKHTVNINIQNPNNVLIDDIKNKVLKTLEQNMTNSLMK